jgi:hypothetical protein
VVRSSRVVVEHEVILNADMDTAGGDLSAAAVDAVDVAIENWLAGVRNVLRFTERLPMLVHVEDDLL